MSDANGHAKGPVSQSSFPLVLRLTMSPSGDIIRVAAVTVVKVEAVKEPVPSQRLSCLVLIGRPDLLRVRSHRTKKYISSGPYRLF